MKQEKLLVVVDMQKDFIDGALGTPEAVAIVPKVRDEIIKTLQRKDTELVFTRDTHQENYLDTREGKMLPVPHCIEGTEGWQICGELAEYAESAKVFDKDTFGSVELMNYIGENGYKEITLMGLCTDICVISNAMLAKAVLPEADIAVLSNCSAGVTPESHDNALKAMEMCHIRVVSE